MDFDSDAKLNHLHCRARMNLLDPMRNEEGYIRSAIHKRLTDQFMSLIVDSIKVTTDKYSKEYAVDLYVLTPDQLEKYVQRRAERLSVGYPGGLTFR